MYSHLAGIFAKLGKSKAAREYAEAVVRQLAKMYSVSASVAKGGEGSKNHDTAGHRAEDENPGSKVDRTKPRTGQAEHPTERPDMFSTLSFVALHFKCSSSPLQTKISISTATSIFSPRDLTS
jgi:hypothetical protein